MWWRRDKRHAGLSMAKPRNQTAHFMARELSAFTGLGTLRHLDLDLLGMRQVLGRDAKAARGNLLDLVVERDMHRRSRNQRFRDGNATLRVHRSAGFS